MNTNKSEEQKKNRHGYTKQEIQENRKRLAENPIREIIYPTLSYWREKPIRAIAQLFSWIIIVYGIMVLLQAVNYDMIYCNSSLEQFNGKIMRTYNPFVEHMNELVIKHEAQNTPTLGFTSQPTQRVMPQELNQTIICNYDLKRWWHEESDLLHNAKEIGVKRWTRNKDTK